MNNISFVKDCYGCGVCSIICPKKIIELETNKDGFYEPIIVSDACIDCGLCLSVCSYIKEDISNLPIYDIKSYACWSKDSKIRLSSSSGGISFELGRHLLKQNYKICGVRYNANNSRVEHYISNNLEELYDTLGSKYLQSYTINGFKEIRHKEKYLIIGTPCQIDSIRHFVRKKRIEDNILLVDFHCHGVPSLLLWKKYTKMVEGKTGNIFSVAWRNKERGWHDSWQIKIRGEKDNFDSWATEKDIFYQLFLGNVCLGKACYDNCKYKQTSSAADIRIGDLWGRKYKDENKGVSGVLCLTEKGDAILKQMEEIMLIEEKECIINEGQMQKGAQRPCNFTTVNKLLKTDLKIEYIYYISRFIDIVINFDKKIYKKIFNRI